ncbi:MAG: 16S rRNA (guanine(527)-N(7))-methyltransferase RsmG [Burkholderiales bacterium]
MAVTLESASLEKKLADGLAALNIALPAAAQQKLIAYVKLIEKWNKVHNLTAVRDLDKMITLHVLDSLTVLPFVAGKNNLLDVGSGAGLPGIPLAIARPDLRVTMLDSNHKKTAFLTQAKTELDLHNCEVINERVELWQTVKKFDAVVSRAYSDLSEFVDQAGHMITRDGELLAMKGVYPHEEMLKLPATFKVEKVAELHVPELDAKRHLVVLNQTA